MDMALKLLGKTVHNKNSFASSASNIGICFKIKLEFFALTARL